MNWLKFKQYFHPSWHKAIQPFIESEECDKIYKFLKAESAGGKKISPASSNVYRCFLETPLDEIQAVMIGGTPYTEWENGQPIADGLLLGCSVTNKLHPKLNNYYRGIEKEFYEGIQIHIIKDPNVEFLCNQGVLMLNLGLTASKGEEKIHADVWEPFMRFLFTEILNPLRVPYIFIDESCDYCKDYLGIFPNIFAPSTPLKSTIGTEWNTENTFTKVNAKIYNTNEEVILWTNVDLPF